MSRRPVYAVSGLFVGAAVNIVGNLLAAAIQQRSLANQFGPHAIWWMSGLSTIGLLVGYWLSAEIQVPRASPSQPTSAGGAKTVTITRLRALLSHATLRGQGIYLSDIILMGSRIEINARD